VKIGHEDSTGKRQADGLVFISGHNYFASQKKRLSKNPQIFEMI